jgi:hypothetical protein
MACSVSHLRTTTALLDARAAEARWRHPGNATTALNLPVYMLQPKSGCMRLEPCRIPPGPKRAPGLAVTPYR